MKKWWLSFADPEKPKGSQFLGAAIICATRFDEAVVVSHIKGINPGGEVKGWLFEHNVPKEFIEKLMDKEEIMNLDKAIGGSGEVVMV